MLVVDDAHVGTSASEWKSSPRVASTPPLQVPECQRVVFVSPHPDDEVLGAGGLLQLLLTSEIKLDVVAVTDGESSHPQSQVAKRLDMMSIRSAETRRALQRLGWQAPHVTRVRIPDGQVRAHSNHLRRVLSHTLKPGDLCVGPWLLDGHPDHDATGEAVASVAEDLGVISLSYLVWALHWAAPEGTDIPWQSCRRLDLTARDTARKRWATMAFRSQIRPLGTLPEDAPVLPSPVLRRHWQSFEIFVDSREQDR